MELVNQIFKTDDYSVFNTLKGNRDLNRAHIEKLKQSIAGVYLVSPILINDRYEIIDGQHRFEAIKELGLPIYFFMVSGYGLDEVQILNTNASNWNSKDYLKAFCDLGYPDYLKMKEFLGEFPDFSVPVADLLLSGLHSGSMAKKHSTKSMIEKGIGKSGYAINKFSNGGFKVQDYELARKNANQLLDFKPYYEGFKRGIFIKSILPIFKLDYYNHKKMIKKLSSNPRSMKNCTNVIQYREMIEDIYNFRSSEKVSFKYVQ